jgi:hypothetical protein
MLAPPSAARGKTRCNSALAAWFKAIHRKSRLRIWTRRRCSRGFGEEAPFGQRRFDSLLHLDGKLPQIDFHPSLHRRAGTVGNLADQREARRSSRDGASRD